VDVTDVVVTEKALRASAGRDDARIHLTLIPGAPIAYYNLSNWSLWWRDPEIDPPRHCELRLTDRRGEPLRIDGTSYGVTDIRSQDQLDEDLVLTVGLAELLAQNDGA